MIAMTADQRRSQAEVARRIRLTRRALGYKGKELARSLRISAAVWSFYETGRNRFPVETALRWGDIDGVTLEWLYDGDPTRLSVDLKRRIDALRDRSIARTRTRKPSSDD